MVSSKAKRSFVLIAAVLLISVMTGSTLAYVTQEKVVLNEFQTGKYSTEIVETFDPPSDWLPGQDINKDVTFANKGTVPVFVKTKIHQDWIRRENVYDGDGNLVSPAKGEAFPLVFTTPDGSEEYAALVTWGENVVVMESGKSGTGSLSLGLPSVKTPAEAMGKWLLLDETPDEDGNYVFYYMGVLNGGSETPLLVDSVEMNPAIEATELSEHFEWENSEGTWSKRRTSVGNPSHAYENSHYTMKVQMFTVQATRAALDELFGADTVSEQSIVSSMGSLAVTGKGEDVSRDDSVTQKRLLLEEKNGKMVYTPVAGEKEGADGWFMSHLNVLPGETYEDEMTIENRSNKTYHLYMQALAPEVPQELLEYIHMKVYYGDAVLYNGTALGKEYTGSIRNLQNVINLGTYKGKSSKDIRVELTLDKDTPMKYADLYNRIDWKFKVEELPETEEPKESNHDSTGGAKTGDSSEPVLYTLIMTISGVLLLLCIWWLVRDRKKKKEI